MKRNIETKVDNTKGILVGSETSIEFKGSISLHNGVICEQEITTGVNGYVGIDELEIHEVIFKAVSDAVTKFMAERKDL